MNGIEIIMKNKLQNFFHLADCDARITSDQDLSVNHLEAGLGYILLVNSAPSVRNIVTKSSSSSPCVIKLIRIHVLNDTFYCNTLP